MFIKKQSILCYENRTDRLETAVRCFYRTNSTISRMMLRTRAPICSFRLWSFISLDVIISPPFDSRIKARHMLEVRDVPDFHPGIIAI